jgi:hypothetical protein
LEIRRDGEAEGKIWSKKRMKISVDEGKLIRNDYKELEN